MLVQPRWNKLWRGVITDIKEELDYCYECGTPEKDSKHTVYYVLWFDRCEVKNVNLTSITISGCYTDYSQPQDVNLSDLIEIKCRPKNSLKASKKNSK